MKLSLVKATTSKIVHLFIGDSSVTTGAGLTGLAFNTASLVAYYVRPGDTGATAITLATCTLGTWTSGGFRELDATNMPGVYEFHIPDACLATGANQVFILLKGAANMRPTEIEIELTAWSNQDSVRGGMTAMPNAAAGASGGLLIVGSNSGSVTMTNLVLTGSFNITGAISIANGIAITRSTANEAGISILGNGSGSGIYCSGGTTGAGVTVVGGATSGAGIAVSTTSGAGISVIPAAGNAVTLSGAVSLGSTLTVTGATTLAAVTTGAISATTIATSGTVTLNALTISAATTFTGAITGTNASNDLRVNVAAISGDATAADNLETMLDGTGGSTLSLGKLSVVNATGNAVEITAGTVGVNDFNGVLITASGTGSGISATGGEDNGTGILSQGQGNGNGIAANGAGTGYGIACDGGAIGFYSTGATIDGVFTATNASNSITGITVATMGANTLTASALATDAVTEINTAVIARLPAALVSGRMDASIGAYQTGLAPLQPTVAGRTLDVSAGGEAGIDWANIGTPSSTVSLTNTTINLVTTVTNLTNLTNIGNGAYTVTATVTDGTDPLQGALVRVTSGIDSFSNLSDGSGEAAFSLNAGTFTVSITKGGYTFTPTTRTVTGNEAGTLVSSDLAMTATVIPATPTDPTYCRIYGYLRDQSTGRMLKGARVTATRVPGSQAYSGGFLVGRLCSAVSDSTGLVQLDVIRTDEIEPTGMQWNIVCKEAGINTTRALAVATFDLSTLV